MGQAIWIDGITSCVMLSINEFQQIWPNFDCNWVCALVFRLSDGVWTRFPLTDCDGDADCRYFNIPTWADRAFAKWMLGWAMNIKEKHRNMEQLQNSNRFFANVSYHIRHGCSEYAYDERYLHRAHCTVHVNEKKKQSHINKNFKMTNIRRKKTKHNIEEHEFPLIYTVGYIRLTKREHTQTHSLANGKQQIVHFVWMLINFERIPCAFWRWCAWMPHNLQCEYHVDDEICVAFSFEQQVASNEMRSLYFIVHHAHRNSSILFCSGFNYISGANFLPTCLIPFPNAISHFFDRHDWS